MGDRPSLDMDPRAADNSERGTPIFNKRPGREMDKDEFTDKANERSPEPVFKDNGAREEQHHSTDLPLVSIITPAYNRAGFLDETIQSVLSQDYPNIEYIVLNDGSTDNTPDVLQKYSDCIYWETQANIGETRTVNKGFSMAKGDIICVVNSDDPLLPGAVSKAVEALTKHSEALVAYPDWLEIDSDSRKIKELKLPNYDIYAMLYDFNVALGPGTFIRKKTFDLVGYRDLTFRYAGDLEFWFRVALHGQLIHIPETLATHRVHEDSASVSSKGAQMAEELILLLKKVFSDPALPDSIRNRRAQLFSKVHREAVYYCGSDRKAILKHHRASFCYNPSGFIIPTVNLFLRRTIYGAGQVFLHKVIYGTLNVFLHRFIGGALRRVLYLTLYAGLPVIRIVLGTYLRLERWIVELFGRSSNTENRKQPGGRFALVSHVLPPLWSGQAVVIERLLRKADPSSYCLISSANHSGDANKPFIPRLSARLHNVPEGRLRHFLSLKTTAAKRFGLFYAAYIRGWHIARIVIRGRYSALVAATGDIVDLPASYLASRIAHIPFIPYLFDDYVHQWQDPVVRTFANHFGQMIYSNAKNIIVPNDFLADAIFRQYSPKSSISIIYNPADDGGPDRKIREESLTMESVNIAYTGAVYHVNFDAFRNLIAAIDNLKVPGLRLHIYTAQPREFLAAAGVCGNNVEYHEHVPPDEATQVRNAAHMLFVPLSFDKTLSEITKTSAPGKLGDYLASGRPIIAHVPADSFVAWYLRKYGCGVVVDREDPKEIGRAIMRLIEDPDFAASVVANAKQRSAVDFAPERARNHFMSIIAST